MIVVHAAAFTFSFVSLPRIYGGAIPKQPESNVSTTRTIRVWDPLVRTFHWTLVAAFSVVFLTEDDFMRVHANAGYLVTALLAFRIVWGFIGTHYARFSNFVHSPNTIMTYLKSLPRTGARRYLGHNPAGGAMIVALIIVLALTSLSGVAVYAIGDNAGPLAGVLGHVNGPWEGILGELHEGLANLSLLLVVVHVTGVLFESIRHRENLVRAMWTGVKRVSH